MFEEKKEYRTGKTDDGGNRWLLTFNDMLTLLLTFFVLILSMSRMDAAKMEEASSAVGSAFGIPGLEEKTEVRVFDPFILSPAEFAAGGERQEEDDDGFGRFLQKRDAFINRFNNGSGMKAQATPKGISVSMGSGLLFQGGSAEIEPGSRAALRLLCSLLEGTRPSIRVEARTDETPSDRERFSTSWELAVARGAQVAQIMVSEGGAAPEKVSVSGYGTVEPAVKGASGKQDLPRRIEVTLYFTKVEGG